eukprot:2253371-Rhodomonas_salina.1
MKDPRLPESASLPGGNSVARQVAAPREDEDTPQTPQSQRRSSRHGSNAATPVSKERKRKESSSTPPG